ncbi:unnamed protein product, partial [Adineta steineri]
YNFEYRLSLPIDRQRSSTDQRSGLGSLVEISFDNEVATSFLNYASSHHVTPFQLGLATFYTFLFKLTHHQKDLCISSLNANRYRNELQNVLGMFVSTLPYRIELNSYWTFDELVKFVHGKCLSILSHSHYPLQHILADFHLNQSNIAFLETVFYFVSMSFDMSQLSVHGTSLEEVSLDQSTEVAKFDFMSTFIYNPLRDNKKLSCFFVCSNDLYEEKTLENIARRFQYFVSQLFTMNPSVKELNLWNIPINNLQIILPEEANELHKILFKKVSNSINEDDICDVIFQVVVKGFLMTRNPIN